jgi:hypothetical protein
MLMQSPRDQYFLGLILAAEKLLIAADARKTVNQCSLQLD